MAGNTGSPTTKAYLAASQAQLNLIFDRFWAKLAGRQLDTQKPDQPRPTKHAAPPGSQTKKRRPHKMKQSLIKLTPTAPRRPGTHSKSQVAVGSKDKFQTNGTLTSTAPQDGGSLCRDAMWHSAAAQPHTSIESISLHKAAERPMISSQTGHWMRE
ncbi:Hypothetical predicted protein [Pelobates cultripes]|uniref:Uncharacterized protein n=1 Tax=Pelobates cultripes TaxID=61616 RepID=A0AAD1RYN7_PELCU|nr:Hypothetical predicted protein [Pelobates cultripes]